MMIFEEIARNAEGGQKYFKLSIFVVSIQGMPIFNIQREDSPLNTLAIPSQPEYGVRI